MKQWIKKYSNRLFSVRSMLLICYITFVVAIGGFCSVRYSQKQFALLCVATVLLAAVLCPAALWLLERVHACPRLKKEKCSCRQVLMDGILYLAPLAVFAVFLIACFPGGYSADSFDQYAQTLDNQYNDWHPVLHTLLAFKLPLALTGGWIGSVVLLQSLCFSGVIGYTGQVIRKHFGFLPAIITVALILLNPLVMLTSMHPWKDTGFAVCALLLSAYCLQIVTTKGKWLHRPLNLICFAVVAVIASVVRHNGILFTAPVILGVALSLSRKRALALCAAVMLLFAVVKFPVYSLLGVEAPDKRQIETLGLPMTVIDAVAVAHPERLDEETLSFVYQVTPKEALEAEYKAGSFNSVKFHQDTNLDVIEQYGAKKVLTFMVRCIKAAPKTALKSLLDLTGRLFLLTDASTGFVYPRVCANAYGIDQSPNMTLIRHCKNYAETADKYLAPVFTYLGIQHLLLVAVVLAKVNLKRRLDWTKLLVVLGVLCYNFGSGLLLSCWMDIFRFFFYTFPVVPVLLIMLCCNHNERNRPLFGRRQK